MVVLPDVIDERTSKEIREDNMASWPRGVNEMIAESVSMSTHDEEHRLKGDRISVIK